MNKNHTPFGGDKKNGTWLLANYEVKLRSFLVPFVPRWCQTYHLTLCTIPESALIVIFCWLVHITGNVHWLWGSSAMILAQYTTDLLDGEIGRKRNTGLIKWGFYMDHLLDYVFLCAILIGYGLLLPQQHQVLQFFIMAIASSFMVNSFLDFAATNTFTISYLHVGPTEVRLLCILANTCIIVLGTHIVAVSVPYVVFGLLFALFNAVLATQKKLWNIDMEAKKTKCTPNA